MTELERAEQLCSEILKTAPDAYADTVYQDIVQGLVSAVKYSEMAAALLCAEAYYKTIATTPEPSPSAPPDNGVPIPDLAKEHKVTVRYELECKYPRFPEVTYDLMDKVSSCWKDGRSTHELMKQFNLTFDRVVALLRKCGYIMPDVEMDYTIYHVNRWFISEDSEVGKIRDKFGYSKSLHYEVNGDDTEYEMVLMWAYGMSTVYISYATEKSVHEVVEILNTWMIPANENIAVMNRGRIRESKTTKAVMDELSKKQYTGRKPIITTMKKMLDAGFPVYNISMHSGKEIDDVVRGVLNLRYGSEKCNSLCQYVQYWIKGRSVEFISSCCNATPEVIVKYLREAGYPMVDTSSDYRLRDFEMIRMGALTSSRLKKLAEELLPVIKETAPSFYVETCTQFDSYERDAIERLTRGTSTDKIAFMLGVPEDEVVDIVEGFKR